mgnify:FL=1
MPQCPQCGYTGKMMPVTQEEVQQEQGTMPPWEQARGLGETWKANRMVQHRAFRTYGPMGYQSIYGSPYEPEPTVSTPAPVASRTRSRWGFEY